MVSPTFDPNKIDYFDFEQQGYHIEEGFLTPESISFLRERYDSVINNLHSSVHPEWVMSLHQCLNSANNWMWHLATEKKLLDFVERHLGPNIVLYSTQLAYKPPGHGRYIPWHQDGERCRTVWIPLDDIDRSSGGMMVCPGLHKQGRVKQYKRVTEESYEDAVFNHQHSVFELDMTLYAPTGSACGSETVEADGNPDKRKRSHAHEVHVSYKVKRDRKSSVEEDCGQRSQPSTNHAHTPPLSQTLEFLATQEMQRITKGSNTRSDTDTRPDIKTLDQETYTELTSLTAPDCIRTYEYRMSAGSLEVHHPSLPHRSLPNLSSKPRRVIILRYQPASEPLNTNPFHHFSSGNPLPKYNYIVRGTLSNDNIIVKGYMPTRTTVPQTIERSPTLSRAAAVIASDVSIPPETVKRRTRSCRKRESI
eukprot:CFRG0405T1